jgi:hypothetical protein
VITGEKEEAMDLSTQRTAWRAAGLMLAGALAGGVLAAEVTASASSGGTPATSSAYTEASPLAPGPGEAGPGEPRGRGHAFGSPLSGTVTALDVTGKTVTIKTSNGTTTYKVDAQSDVDKNGEAQLSDLKAGDAVRFAVRPGTSTIAVLHAGDEAKDRPAMRPGGPGGRHVGGPCPNMGGARGSAKPVPTPSSST